MPAVSTLYSQIGYRINDPSAGEVPTGAGSQMLTWINEVIGDSSQLTDALQVAGSISGDGSATSFTLPTPPSGSTFWRVLSIYDVTAGIQYEAVSRQEFQGYYNQIITNSVGGMYVYNVFGYKPISGTSTRKIHILPVVANLRAVTVEYSITAPALATGDAALPGLYDQYSELVVTGVETLYWRSVGDMNRASESFARYIDWNGRLAGEVGTNPVIKPEMSSIYHALYKAVKSVKEG